MKYTHIKTMYLTLVHSILTLLVILIVAQWYGMTINIPILNPEPEVSSYDTEGMNSLYAQVDKAAGLKHKK